MELHLNSIIYEYPSATKPILNGLTASFKPGWTGIIGDNGCGKSTLARIAARQLHPDDGQVVPRLIASYCEQDSSLKPPELEDFVQSYDDHAIRLRTKLGIEDEWAYRFDSLSSGQRKRLQVAVSLWLNGDLLVMDEPTNHIDTSTRETIACALESYHAIGLLISHDRDLLDRLCGQCLFFEVDKVTMRPGSYTQGVAQFSLERTTATHSREKAKCELRRIEVEAQRRHQLAEQTATRRSGKNLDKNDNSGREKLRLAVLTGQDGKTGRLSARISTRLDSALMSLEDTHVPKHYQGDIWMDARLAKRKILLRVEACSFPLEEERKLQIPNLYIGNSDHIGLVGDNGSGKTTLVRRLIHSLPQDVPYLFIPQEVDLLIKEKSIKKLHSMADKDRGRMFSIIAQLNSDPSRMRQSKQLSPGEMRKLILAQGLLEEPSLIIMDEPTNHLDIGSIEALESLLMDFPGALLLVSHDRNLIKSTTNIKWKIKITERDNFLETLL